MTQIIDGKLFAENLRKEIAAEVAKLPVKPGLAVVLVGHDPASEVYVRNKHRQTIEVGMNSFEFKLPDTISQAALIEKIHELNADENVHGILVQLPLPKHIEEVAVINAISPAKDVDGFHVINVGRLVTGQKNAIVPCTPLGSLMLIKSVMPDLNGVDALVVGKSNIAGKPMAALLMNEGATVTVAHSKTKDLKALCMKSELIVVAAGRPGLITDCKKDAVIIDIGINRLPNGKLTGDADFEALQEKARHITPVPGGVGPMTIACLLHNTLTLCSRGC